MLKKVYLSVVLTCVVILLAACGAPPAKDAAPAASGGAKAPADSGVVKFATDASYAPMEFMDLDKVSGFDVDFVDAVMKEAGMKYEVNNIGWDTMLESVKQGTEYQAGISAISITKERKKTYNFSLPYFESTNMIMFKEGSDIKNALDLKGKKVAVQNGTTADLLMSKMMGQNSTNLKKFDSNALALQEMANGGVDAVVADIAVVREYIKNNPGSKLKGITDSAHFSSEYYGIAYPKNSALKAKLDPAIQAVVDNGTYAKIYKKWFGQEPNLTHLKAEMAKKE